MTTAILPCQEQTPVPVAQIQLEDEQTVAATKAKQMNTQLVLLLTRDRSFEKTVSEALHNAVVIIAQDVDKALQNISARSHELNLVVIDFDDGCHGMTLLSAISMLREDLPIIVITHDDEKHVEALACANGATACFSKPFSTTQLVVAIREFCSPKPKPALA